MSADIILHLIPAQEYRALAEDEPVRAASLETEGFLHCTRQPEVLLRVANNFYRAAPGDFLVLVIDVARVTAPVKLEPPVHPAPPADPLAGLLFPHIYGPLNREAIIAVREARRAPDGTFLST